MEVPDDEVAGPVLLEDIEADERLATFEELRRWAAEMRSPKKSGTAPKKARAVPVDVEVGGRKEKTVVPEAIASTSKTTAPVEVVDEMAAARKEDNPWNQRCLTAIRKRAADEYREAYESIYGDICCDGEIVFPLSQKELQMNKVYAFSTDKSV